MGTAFDLGKEQLEEMFPALRGTSWDIKSDGTPVYNCLAWAVGENHRRWDTDKPHYWPDNNRHKFGIAYLVAAYRAVGFVVSNIDACVPDAEYEKIVLYCRDTEGSHAARLLANGRWTSKIGSHEDIEHETPGSLIGSVYGKPMVYMRRKKTDGKKKKVEKRTAE